VVPAPEPASHLDLSGRTLHQAPPGCPACATIRPQRSGIAFGADLSERMEVLEGRLRELEIAATSPLRTFVH